MLDSNTNKVTWVGIAVGIVALLGVATSQLYPQAFDSAKNAMTQTLIYQAATPRDLKYNGDATLTKAKDYEPGWDLLEYPLNFEGQNYIVTKPGQWTLMEFYFKADQDASAVALDINNIVTGKVGNDHDNVNERKFAWYDENGKLISDSLTAYNIKAGKVYHVVARYHNTNDFEIRQEYERGATNFGIRPEGGITDSSKVNVKFYNYRVF